MIKGIKNFMKLEAAGGAPAEGALFQQLGLPNKGRDIDRFVAEHALGSSIALS